MLKKWDQNWNVWKASGRIPMFGRIRSRNPKFIKKETRIPMFGKGNKSYNVSKDTATIPRCTGTGAQFQCLQG